MTPMLDGQTAESRSSGFEPRGMKRLPVGKHVLRCLTTNGSTGGTCSKHLIDRRGFPALMVAWPPPHSLRLKVPTPPVHSSGSFAAAAHREDGAGSWEF